MKKFIAVLLTFTVIFTLGIPAFAAEKEFTEDTVMSEEHHQETKQPQNGEDENGYLEKLLSVYSAGARNLGNGVVVTVFTMIVALPMCVIPIGALVGILGIPAGISMSAIGVGELLSAPVIAAFMNENTNLEPLTGFDAEDIFEMIFS